MHLLGKGPSPEKGAHAAPLLAEPEAAPVLSTAPLHVLPQAASALLSPRSERRTREPCGPPHARRLEGMGYDGHELKNKGRNGYPESVKALKRPVARGWCRWFGGFMEWVEARMSTQRFLSLLRRSVPCLGEAHAAVLQVWGSVWGSTREPQGLVGAALP